MTTEPKITRRQSLLGLGAAAGSLPLLAAAVGAPAPAAAQGGAAAPFRAIHRFHLGAMRVTVIDDGSFTFPAAAFAANQPEGSIAPFLGRFGLPGDFVNLHLQVTLIERGEDKVLIDTGLGDVTFPGNDPDNGRLAAGLAAIGVGREDITAVIISHGHPDHIGACSVDGAPAFPNAAYFIPPEELEFWTQKPGDEASFPNFMLAVGNRQLEPLRGLIRTYRDGDEILPGVTAVAAPGHTLAHHAFMIGDGGARLLHMVDAAVHYLVGPEEPDWALAVEMDPDAAARTRRRLFRRAADEKLLVAGYHFPFPGLGRIVEDGAHWRFVPVPTA